MIERSLIAAAAALMICAAPAGAASGVNVGSLSCKVSGGVGFIFGSSKTMNCVFTRADGSAEVSIFGDGIAGACFWRIAEGQGAGRRGWHLAHSPLCAHR